MIERFSRAAAVLPSRTACPGGEDFVVQKSFGALLKPVPHTDPLGIGIFAVQQPQRAQVGDIVMHYYPLLPEKSLSSA